MSGRSFPSFLGKNPEFDCNILKVTQIKPGFKRIGNQVQAALTRSCIPVDNSPHYQRFADRQTIFARPNLLEPLQSVQNKGPKWARTKTQQAMVRYRCFSEKSKVFSKPHLWCEDCSNSLHDEKGRRTGCKGALTGSSSASVFAENFSPEPMFQRRMKKKKRCAIIRMSWKGRTRSV